MVADGVDTWVAIDRFRIHYFGVAIIRISLNKDKDGFDLHTHNRTLIKSISQNLDEMIYVDEITVRRKHTGIQAFAPTKGISNG